MPEAASIKTVLLPHELMANRLEQSQQMRDFFIEILRRNPASALQGGARVRAPIEPFEHGSAEGPLP